MIATAGTSYVYDGDGNRVEKCTEGTTPGTCTSSATGMFYSMNKVDGGTIAESDLSGNWLAAYGLIRGQIVSRMDLPSNTVHYYFRDHLGSTNVVTDASGNILNESDHTPYGKEVPITSGDSNRYKFTGKERDSESGLDYFGARFDASSMGRFMTPDPLPWPHWQNGSKGERRRFVEFLANPQNFNMYSYVRNNPLNSIDPNGEDVYVVLYTTGNSKGDDELKRAAQTKANQIENSKGFDPKKDTVLVAGVSTKADVTNAFKSANALGKTYGGVQELDMFSHSGIEGPVLHGGQVDTLHPNGSTQFSGSELKSLPGLNWNQGATATFFGCNTTTFAGQFANDERVRSFGTTGSAYFSGRPDRMAPDTGGSLYMIDSYFNRIVPNFMNYAAPMEQHDPD